MRLERIERPRNLRWYNNGTYHERIRLIGNWYLRITHRKPPFWA